MESLRTDALLPPVHALGVLASTSSFTQAAVRLGLSKAAVSQRIAELERALGVTLVHRTTRSVRLTPAGEQLVAATAEGWERIAHALALARDGASEAQGLVRMTAPVALGRQHIAPWLPEFLRAHPAIKVDLDLSDRLIALAQEGFDLAIRHTHAPPDNHVATKLAATPTLLVASKAYLRRRGTPRHPGELTTHDCIAYLRPGPSVWRFEKDMTPSQRRNTRKSQDASPERVTALVHGPLRANNSEVLRDAVLAGLGVALVPEFSAAAALRAGRLTALLPGWRPIGFFGDALYALRPWSAHTPKAVHALIEHLKQSLATSLRGGG